MRFLLLAILALSSVALFGALIMNTPVTLTQPDGTSFECLVSGDEFYNYYHDNDGYTIIPDTNGYYTYAVADNGLVIPGAYRVGTVNPASVGIEKHVHISSEEYQARRDRFQPETREDGRCPSTGAINNIVIFIRFSDQSEFVTARSTFDDRFNSETPPSMYSYFNEVSYNTLQVTSHFYPTCALTTNLSYQDTHPRSYYCAYSASNTNGYQNDSEASTRKYALLTAAVNAIASQVPTDLDLDGDHDNKIDNTSFIIRGSSEGWADLLWAHRGWFSSSTVTINGKRVWDYTFEPENQNDVNTVCHEMFHSIGAPDLYRSHVGLHEISLCRLDRIYSYRGKWFRYAQSSH
jgi:hypothetical protein